jgi:hypothetical protein
MSDAGRRTPGQYLGNFKSGAQTRAHPGSIFAVRSVTAQVFLSAMSERLTAPARSPLRRAFPPSGKESPNRNKKSPLQRGTSQKKQDSSRDADADALRAQAEEIEHDINHLSPALQRFWQVKSELVLKRKVYTKN